MKTQGLLATLLTAAAMATTAISAPLAPAAADDYAQTHTELWVDPESGGELYLADVPDYDLGMMSATDIMAGFDITNLETDNSLVVIDDYDAMNTNDYRGWTLLAHRTPFDELTFNGMEWLETGNTLAYSEGQVENNPAYAASDSLELDNVILPAYGEGILVTQPSQTTLPERYRKATKPISHVWQDPTTHMNVESGSRFQSTIYWNLNRLAARAAAIGD